MRNLKAYLGIARHRRAILRFPLAGDPLQVSALAECGHGDFGQPAGARPFPDRGSNIGGESVLEARLGVYQGASLLMPGQPLVVHERSFGVELQDRKSTRLNSSHMSI